MNKYLITFLTIIFVTNAHAETSSKNAIFQALKIGKESEILSIINSPNFDPNIRNDNANTALHLSAYAGYKKVVQVLIDRGANIDDKDNEGYTPLHWASFKGYTQIVSLLIKQGADVNNKNDRGAYPIFEACQEGHKDIVILLVENGANINVKLGHFTPKGVAEHIGHHDIVEYLDKYNKKKIDKNL